MMGYYKKIDEEMIVARKRKSPLGNFLNKNVQEIFQDFWF